MSYKTCAFTPPFLLRNFAHGNVARHNEIVVESNAYFFPEMSRMLVVRFSQALTVTQLSKHHRKHLIPASEMFHISVAIILANIIVELSPVQKSGWLREYVFALEHSSYLYQTAKLQNQVRFISKNRVIDYISIISKNYLSVSSHFRPSFKPC